MQGLTPEMPGCWLFAEAASLPAVLMSSAPFQAHVENHLFNDALDRPNFALDFSLLPRGIGCAGHEKRPCSTERRSEGLIRESSFSVRDQFAERS